MANGFDVGAVVVDAILRSLHNTTVPILYPVMVMVAMDVYMPDSVAVFAGIMVSEDTITAGV